MGIFKKGINGPFSGKTGSVIGSKWKKIHYMKGLPKKRTSSKVPSADQALQRQKFKLLLSFLSPVKNLLEIGLKPYLHRQTAVNAGMALNYDVLYVKEGDPLRIDFSKVNFSHGSLFTPGDESAVLTANGIGITWDPKTYGVSGSLDDRIHAFAYREEGDDGRFFSADDHQLKRYQGQTFITLTEAEIQGTFHVWLFLSSADGTKRSKTVYVPLDTTV